MGTLFRLVGCFGYLRYVPEMGGGFLMAVRLLLVLLEHPAQFGVRLLGGFE
jgi:hypothetical protein